MILNALAEKLRHRSRDDFKGRHVATWAPDVSPRYLTHSGRPRRMRHLPHPVYPLLQDLAGHDPQDPSRRDRHRLPGRQVATTPRAPIAHDKDPEARQLHVLAANERRGFRGSRPRRAARHRPGTS